MLLFVQAVTLSRLSIVHQLAQNTPTSYDQEGLELED